MRRTALILSTREARDRLTCAIQEVSKLGFDAEPFLAIEDADPRVSFNRSMKQVLSSTEDVVAVFEDDVEIRGHGHFESAISQLPKDWELCYLGANITGEIVRISPNLFRMYGAWTTHAVLYNNPSRICEGFLAADYMFDEWLRVNVHPRGRTYIVSPMIAWQLPHHSSLWDQMADYTSLLDESAARLI